MSKNTFSCWECGKEISRSVRGCPHCGRDFSKKEQSKIKKPRNNFHIILLIILVSIGVLFFF